MCAQTSAEIKRGSNRVLPIEWQEEAWSPKLKLKREFRLARLDSPRPMFLSRTCELYRYAYRGLSCHFSICRTSRLTARQRPFNRITSL